METAEKETSLLLKTISNKKEINKTSSHFRPFLSYKNFKKNSQEKLDSFKGEENILNENNNVTSTYSIVQLLKGGHSLCRVIKQFSDGRIWIEIGGHELLLMQTVNLNTEILQEDKEINFHSPQSTFSIGNISSSTSPHSPNSHLTNCIFANNKSSSMIRATSLGGYPERMPFSSFNHSFRCLLKNKEFIIKNSEEKEENNNNSIDERENVRRILKRAGIAEHRFRLGLSQILLQRELLEELENKRSVVLLPLLSEFQANCRKYLTSKRMQNEREKVEAIRIIQWNFERWKDLKKSEWWKLFVNIRPLIPVSSADARERRLREHLAQLELELDELRSEHSRAQLELESALKSKQIAEKWSEEIGQRNKKLIVELEEAEEKLKKSVKTSEQLNGTTPNGIKQMPTAFEWENDPRTVELRKQLNDALDRERTFQHKVQKTTDELLDARAEIDVINAKNERLEKRLKNSNDELINLREQLDQSMDHRETLERQQFELNLKESRKRAELQRELEAKEDEMEEMRIQYQRKIRNLESALDDAQIENSSLLKQKKAAWQRNSQSASMNGSLLDLAQNTSTENRTLRRKLAKALSLLQNSQINFDKDSFEGNSQLRKQNLGSTVFSSVCGGSEFDDLEDMLLEEDGKDLQKEEGNISILKPKEERGSRETSLLAIENDGANSDTVEDSSCGAEEMPASSNNIN